MCGCNLVCRIIPNPDLLQVDVERGTKVREEREMIRTTLEGTKASCQQYNSNPSYLSTKEGVSNKGSIGCRFHGPSPNVRQYTEISMREI